MKTIKKAITILSLLVTISIGEDTPIKRFDSLDDMNGLLKVLNKKPMNITKSNVQSLIAANFHNVIDTTISININNIADNN